jgi:hypothetical protein
MTPGIPDPAEIAEVHGFGAILETPQHDSVYQWCSVAPTQPFGRHVIGRRERGGEGAPGRGEESTWLVYVCSHLSMGGLYIVGRGCTLPLRQGTTRAAVAKGGGAKPPLPTLKLFPSPLGP